MSLDLISVKKLVSLVAPLNNQTMPNQCLHKMFLVFVTQLSLLGSQIFTLIRYACFDRQESGFFKSFNYLAQKLCFWTGIIFIRVYVSVCVSVCECLYRLSQKVLDRF